MVAQIHQDPRASLMLCLEAWEQKALLRLKNTKTNPHQNEYEEIDILSIANMLTDSDLNLSDDILKEIKIRLETLFEQINLDEVTSANFSSEELNSLGNKNFIHIMNFLEELESLIKLEKNGKI